MGGCFGEVGRWERRREGDGETRGETGRTETRAKQGQTGGLSLFNIMLNLMLSHALSMLYLCSIYAWAMEGVTHIFLPNGLQTENLLFCLMIRFVVENQVIESRIPRGF